MGLILLIGFSIQILATLAGFVLLRRRIEGLNGEIVGLRQALENETARRVVARVRRVAGGASVADVTIGAPPAAARAARAWHRPHATHKAPTTPTQRALALAALALLPAFAFFLRADGAAIISGGLGLAAAMMLIGLREDWKIAAWVGVAAGGLWALTGLALTHGDPASLSAGLVLAAAGGLAHAYARHTLAGPAMALLMAAAAAVLGLQTGMVGPAGAGFGVIVAASALVGAQSLRLEALHLAAFGAALGGLFVLSGQDGAAIWFTPAAAWAGAIFFAIAMVRTPMLGARGASLAATGALTPLFAIAALYLSGHGLGDARAAACAFAALGLALCGLLKLAISRRERGAAGLKLTLWVLAGGAFSAFAAAIGLVAPAPLAAPIFAALSLALMLLNAHTPNAAWRMMAAICGVCCALAAWAGAMMVLQEASHWSPWALIGLGLALPAVPSGAGARAAHLADAPLTAAWLQCVAFGLAIASANLVVRALFSGGAPRAEALGFVEACMHISVWLGAALVIGWRAKRRSVGLTVAALLSSAAFTASAITAALWLTPYWRARESTESWGGDQALLLPALLFPALLFMGNWLLWRRRGARLQARLALNAGALLSACFITLASSGAEDMPGWSSALIGGTVFALAVAVNFAPEIIGRRRPIYTARRVPARADRPGAPDEVRARATGSGIGRGALQH